METLFSARIAGVPRSFIREILKSTEDRSVISFAGGLPNRELFPAGAIQEAIDRVFENFGNDVFQYSNSEGFLGLREMISQRYREKQHLDIPADQILITCGSQQGLDLLGKVLVNEGDGIIIEEPGYLGAIQAFSIFRPRFHPIPLNEDGLDIRALKSVISCAGPRLIYTIPNFQNPSGISYPERNRLAVAEIVRETNMILIEDDPYGDLRYSGTPAASFKKLCPENTILLGTFSKTLVPGFRLGWVAAPEKIMDKLVIAKQAADLNTGLFTQCIVYQYLKDNDVEKHLARIKEAYGRQMKAMQESIREYFPPEVKCTHPQGGMFLWASLPYGISSRKLLDLARRQKVIFVPGDSFYINREEVSDMRLNFSCADPETIRTGIRRLAGAINDLIQTAHKSTVQAAG